MQEAQGGRADLTPEESWRTIHETVGRVQSSMYVAGTATILLLWGIIVSVGYLSQFAIASLTPGFAEATRGSLDPCGPLWPQLGWWAAESSGTAQAGRTWRARQLAVLASGCSSSGSL